MPSTISGGSTGTPGTTTVATFTSSGSWTCPAGIAIVALDMVGGGGAAPSANSVQGAGGNGTRLVIPAVTVVPGTVYTITIGAGGASGASYNSQNARGGATSALGYSAPGASGNNPGGAITTAAGNSGVVIITYMS